MDALFVFWYVHQPRCAGDRVRDVVINAPDLEQAARRFDVGWPHVRLLAVDSVHPAQRPLRLGAGCWNVACDVAVKELVGGPDFTVTDWIDWALGESLPYRVAFYRQLEGDTWVLDGAYPCAGDDLVAALFDAAEGDRVVVYPAGTAPALALARLE